MILQKYPAQEAIAGTAGKISEVWHRYFRSIQSLLGVNNFYSRGDFEPETTGIAADTISMNYSLVNGSVAVSIKIYAAGGVTAEPGATIELPKAAINKSIGTVINGLFFSSGEALITDNTMKITVTTGNQEIIINANYLTKSETQE